MADETGLARHAIKRHRESIAWVFAQSTPYLAIRHAAAHAAGFRHLLKFDRTTRPPNGMGNARRRLDGEAYDPARPWRRASYNSRWQEVMALQEKDETTKRDTTPEVETTEVADRQGDDIQSDDRPKEPA